MLLTVGGLTVESIDYFNRTSVLFDTFLPSDKRDNNADLGFWTPPQYQRPDPMAGHCNTNRKVKTCGLYAHDFWTHQRPEQIHAGGDLGQQGLQTQLQLAQAADVCDVT